MTVLGYHSNASMAVKAVVKELRSRLGSSFNFLQGIPDFFYDFEKGLSPQFKQYYAKIPSYNKQNPWLTIAYSYDSADSSSIQPRNGFTYYRTIGNNLKRAIDLHYVDLPVVFSLLTNDSKLLNALAAFLLININWSFTCDFQDLLWPTWLPETQFPVGWYIRPTTPNGKLYKVNIAGKSGKYEPEWLTEEGSTMIDNSVQWECIEPDLLTVKAGSFVKNDTIIQNPIESGIMYQYDFGLTLHFVEMIDAGDLMGTVTAIELNLLNYYNEKPWQEQISV